MREGEKGTRAGGRGEGVRAERMGEGLFVHASNSLGVISIACSIIVPFEEGKKILYNIESFLSVTRPNGEGLKICDL